MMEEQMHEVNKKIKQIEGIINKRKEKIAQWNVDYRKIIQEKQDKTYYMQKSCASRIDFRNISPQNYQIAKKNFQKKAEESRLRGKQYYNELKELDYLQKQKNKIRLLLVNKNARANKENVIEQQSKKNHHGVKQNQKIIKNENINQMFSRTTKDRCNPFLDVKAEKFIELSQQSKNNEESLGPKIMKYFSVGLESTPLGVSLKKQFKKSELLKKSETRKAIKSKMSKTSFGKDFARTFSEKQKIFSGNYEPRNIFEDRMRKIIKYHGNFWNQQQFEIK